jgi:4-hydroxy-tetrahydrodipicolinate synthase
VFSSPPRLSSSPWPKIPDRHKGGDGHRRVRSGSGVNSDKENMESSSLVRGVHAAVLTTRDAQGRLNEAAFASQLEFLLTHGIRKFAFNGATGEYCLTSSGDLQRILKIAHGILPSDTSFLCGVGAAGLYDSLVFAHIGIEAGAEALLAPMPYFFPYSQNDLEEFVRQLARGIPGPILLYNLPQFTSALETETAVFLLREVGNL